jgi:2-C-methyl-D-erythritol 4-phosphate cytidylyltransferase/2-C-methyl-D-erythritol 2,4-cyclodiphosphate synthase
MATRHQDTGLVLAAAGSGSRFDGQKQFLEIAGRAVVHRSLDAFAVDSLVEVVAVFPEADLERGRALLRSWREAAGAKAGRLRRLEGIAGGNRRQDSILLGLERLSRDVSFVLVHDAARPLIRAEDVERVLAAAREHGAAAIGTPVSDSIKRVGDGGVIVEDLPRKDVWTVQTPQAARLADLRAAYSSALDFEWTDEASVLRHSGIQVRLVEGSRDNLKITLPGDEDRAEALVRSRDPGSCYNPPLMYRTGLGFDNHRLVPGGRLIIGGIEVSRDVGTVAHSDGDVLVHALCDALYGAIGAGDIGEHFPDSDPRWKGQASALFLEHASRVVRDSGFHLVNVDATVFLQSIKLAPFRAVITRNLLGRLREFWELPESSVSVKAKTMEKCDAVGRDEAVAAQVAVLVRGTRGLAGS